MATRNGSQLVQVLTQRNSIERIKEGNLAEMNALEVEEMARQIAEENSALETRSDDVSHDFETGDDSGITGTRHLDDKLPEMRSDGNDGDAPRYHGSNFSPDDERYIPEEAATETLYDHLNDQLGELDLSEQERVIAEQVIGNIDDNGWLIRSSDLIADDVYFKKNIDVQEDDVERVIEKIRQFDPPGVACRTLQECILMQLKQMKPSPEQQLAIEIIENHWKDFVKGYDRIKAVANADSELLDRAWRLIHRKVNPKPGSAFAGSGGNGAQLIIPEFHIDVQDNTINVTLPNRIPELEISKSYSEAYDEMAGKTAKSGRESGDMREIKANVENGRKFIQMLKNRQQNLFRTMESIVRRQRDYFLSEGDRRLLKPMVLREIAQDIGKDVSYVSRATSGKYASTSWGENIRLGELFSEGVKASDDMAFSQHAAKEHLQDIIDDEDKKNPLSDDQISRRLKDMGFPIERRTVSKYRKQLGILSSKERQVLS